MNKVINFEDIRDTIIAELKNPERKFDIREPVVLFEGVVDMPFFKEISSSPHFSGATVPMIMLIGKSGQLYFLSLKVILPDLIF